MQESTNKCLLSCEPATNIQKNIFFINKCEYSSIHWLILFVRFSFFHLVYSGFLDSSFCRLFARSTLSMIARFWAATYAWSNEINVLTKATGADRTAATLSKDSPKTVERNLWIFFYKLSDRTDLKKIILTKNISSLLKNVQIFEFRLSESNYFMEN